MQKNVLLTGSEGYIGKHIRAELVANNILVHSLDRQYGRDYRFVTAGELVHWNITDIIHCGADISVPESTKNPIKYYDNNVSGTINLVASAVDARIPGTFYFSSSAAAGLEHGNPYGRTKSVIEDFLSDVSNAYDHFKCMSLRYFNVAGANPKRRLGPSLDDYHIIPALIRAAMDDTEFHLYGTNLATETGTCVRGYIHVQDIAEAYVELLNLNLGMNNLIFDVAHNGVFSNRYIIEKVQEITGRRIRLIEHENKRSGDPDSIKPNRDKLTILGIDHTRNVTMMIEDNFEYWKQLHTL